MPRLNRKPQVRYGKNCEDRRPALPFEFCSANRELYLQSRPSDDPVALKTVDLRPGNSDLGQRGKGNGGEKSRSVHMGVVKQLLW